MRLLASLVLVSALASPVAAAPLLSPVSTPLALSRLALASPPGEPLRVVNYTMSNGQTLAIRLFAGSGREERRRIDSMADRLEAVVKQQRAEQGKDGYIDEGDPDWSAYSGGEFGGQDVQFRVEDGVALACATIGAAAQKFGYVNIWLDAVNALCLSVVIVDLAPRLGAALYPLYQAVMRSRRPKVNMVVMMMYSYGGLPIF
jgi:hypothetical protein